jgi:hypothetical protein
MTPEQIQQEADKASEWLNDPIERGAYKSGFKDGYNACQSRHAWAKVSERLPTKEDAVDGYVDYYWLGPWDQKWKKESRAVDARFRTDAYWRTPLDNNFPKTESNEIENL